jgi:allantoicase
MTTDPSSSNVVYPGLVDLACETVGGRAVAASDELFAEKENLVKSAPAVFDPDRYTDRGKWMDGWESRRRRTAGHDWCVVRLGIPGIVRAVDVDTSHFLGNHPAEAAVSGCRSGADGEGDVTAWPWRPLAARIALGPGRHNLLPVVDPEVVDHVRLEIHPDGGVARLRVWGEPRPPRPEGVFDLAALVHGGRAVACSDMFFGRMEHLILPGSPVTMGGGWETRRRRGPGHDWAVIRLAAPARVERVEIDTMHFKGNYPERATVEIGRAGHRIGPLECAGLAWGPLVHETRLGPDANHVVTDLAAHEPGDHVRLSVHPDGGVARLRVFGRPVDVEPPE